MRVCKKCGESMYQSGKAKIWRCRSCSNRRASEHYKTKVRTKLKGIALEDKDRESRANAKLSGITRYESVITCKHGHTGQRLVSTFQCCTCLKERALKIRKRSNDEMKLKKQQALRRKIARNLGLKRFKSAIKCAHGHLGERLVSTSQCCECLALRNKPECKQYKTSEDSKRKNNARRRSRAGKVKSRVYYKEVLSSSPKHKAIAFMRQCLRRINHAKDGRKTVDILGYSREQFIARIEMNFKDGMNWENYGEWHIDHTKPISAFLEQGVDDPKIVNALCNLKPMWAKDNLSKGGVKSV